MKDRREVLAVGAGALPGLALGVTGEESCERPARGPDARHFPNHVVVTHEGFRALFYDDLVVGKTVVLHCMSIATEPLYRTAEALARVQPLLAGRLGRDVFFYSLTVDPERDTPQALREFAARHGAGPGWLFLTGETAVMHELRDRLFQGGGHVHDGQPGCSLALLRYGNAAAGLWGSVPARSDAEWIAKRLAWVQTREPAAGPPRRRGPAPLRTLAAVALGLGLLAAAPARAQQPPAEPAQQGSAWNYPPCPYSGSPTYPDLPGVCHPYQQPWPPPSTQTTTGCPGDCKTTVATGEGIFPPSNPFNYKTFPGTNFLPTIYTNVFDSQGNEVLNTLPSTPSVPYNLHAGDPVVSLINPMSPEDDLRAIFEQVLRLAAGDSEQSGLDPLDRKYEGEAIRAGLRRANDILEGNPVQGRAYSGFPLLHYTGPEKVKAVVPVKDAQGNVVDGNVDVHQVWFDQRIESDTAFIDASAMPANVPWTVTYTVDVLNRGRDDFSPYVMYVDAPTKKPGVGMDQSFFDMEEGTRTVFRIKMAPAPYFNLVYTWGWRMHPPRAQVMENAGKTINYGSGGAPPACPVGFQGKTLPQLEQAVFCLPENPNCTSVRCGPGEPRTTADGQPSPCEKQKLFAISKIGEIAPEKRMWRAVEEARKAAGRGDMKAVAEIVRGKALPAYRDWLERNELPAGVEKDPDSDVTLLYVNNTTYGVLTNGAWGRWDVWEERPKKLRVTVYNGDNFVHSYTIADFGGNRGWENQFKSSVKVAGSGCWFTFGRNYWWLPVGGPVNPYVCVPPANGLTPGRQKIEVDLNFDPSRRLRFYQFDPFHHDVAIYSIH